MGIKVREFMEQPRTVKHIVLKVIWFSDSKVMFKIFLPGSKIKRVLIFWLSFQKSIQRVGTWFLAHAPLWEKKNHKPI